MHARLYIFLFIILLLVSCSKQSKEELKNDRARFKLKGPVKSVVETTYSLSGKYLTYLYFNTSGYILEQASFNPDGSLIRKWINLYDDNNLQQSRTCYVGNDSLSYIIRYYYNKHKKLSSTKVFKPNGSLKSQHPTEYDHQLKVIKETSLGEDATFDHLVLHRYNQENKLTEDIYIDSLSNKSWKQTYQYTNDTLLAEIAVLSSNDSLLKKTKYTYFKDKKVEKVLLYDAQMHLVSIKGYSYDKMGNVSAIIELLPENKTPENQTFQYTYDPHGNWIFLSESVNQQPGTIITRELEYFN